MEKYSTLISQDEKYADLIEAIDNVANELAEVNRLKIIELKLSPQIQALSPTLRMQMAKEIEGEE